MACQPGKQLYDCERQDSTNLEVFSVTEGTTSEITSTGLADGQTIPILVKDETGEYVPYLIGGEQIVLSEDNPSVVIEEPGMYKLDTSAIECPETGITVTATPTTSDIATSVTGCYMDAEGNSVPVEIIRYGDGTTPVVYNLGTGERIANPIGEFSQNCCDCDDGDVTPIQVISETEQLGCAVDAEGNLIGRVYFVPTLDGDGNMISNRMIMVALDGTVTDPYTGTWEECVGDGDSIDVELNYLCVIDNATGRNLQSIIQEILYDSEGVRIGSRIVDRITGGPVALPGGATIGVCPDECLPEPFSTECFEILEEQVQYDNAGGTDPQLCGAPASGPADGGGNIPFIPCPGNYLITSWIINGAEVITGGPVSFRGQVCGSTADGQIGLHEDWARALNLIDGAAGWTNEYSTECANYVRVLNPDPNREYGAMVITDATDASRVWTITNGVRRTIAEERFTRVYQRECDGSIGTIWLDSTGEVIPQPEGNLQPCGMIEEEACVTCDTMTLCDTYIGAGESIFTTTPVPFAELPVITPTYPGQEPMDPAQEALLWSGDTAIIPAAVNPTQNQIHVTSGAVLSTTEPLVGPVEISVQMDWRRTGPNRGQLNTGGLFLMNGDTRIAYEFYPGYTPVDATGQLIVTATVPAEDIAAGNIVIVSLSETHHQGNSGGWELSRLLVLEGGVEETQKFLRTICRSCDGRVVSVQDTAFDGITEYEVQGEVSACGGEVQEPTEAPGCPIAFATECFVQLEGQAQYDNAGGADPAACGAPVSGPGGNIAFPCQGNFLITSWIVDGEEVITAPVPFTGETCGGDGGAGQIGMHADWARALDMIDDNSGWGIDWSQACQYYVRLLEATKDYGAMVIQDADDASRVWTINGAAQSMSETMYTRVFQQDCDGNISSVWLDIDGNEVDTPEGNLVPCGSGGSDCCEPQPPVIEETMVSTGLEVSGIGEEYTIDTMLEGVNLQSVTVTVIEGVVTMTDLNGLAQDVPAGVSLTWSVQKDQDSKLSGFLIEVPGTAYAIINYTAKPEF